MLVEVVHTNTHTHTHILKMPSKTRKKEIQEKSVYPCDI